MEKKNAMSVESATDLLLELRAQKALVEKKLDDVARFLKPILKRQPEKSLLAHKFLFTLEQLTQDHFRLKDAKKKIPLKTLKPFITTSPVERIRTKFIGDNEELLEAA